MQAVEPSNYKPAEADMTRQNTIIKQHDAAMGKFDVMDS